MITNNLSRLQLGFILLAGVSLLAIAADEVPAAAAPESAIAPEPVSVTPDKTEEVLAPSLPEPAADPQAAAAPEPAPAPEAVVPTSKSTPTIRDGVPERYVVKKGDTLWAIAEHFLKDPWLWPEVWQVNPKIRNPHLIYPGDVIVLQYDANGKPVLVLEGTQMPAKAPSKDKSGLPVVKMEPQVRTEKLRKAVGSLNKDVIAAFLNRPYLLSDDLVENSAYVVSSLEEHLASADGARVYAKGLENTTLNAFAVVRPGQKYIDPETGDELGTEGIFLADTRLVKIGDPSKLIIGKSRQEIIDGDLLVPQEKTEINSNFFPRAPKKKIQGQIISVYQGVSRIGQYNVVAINRGEDHGLESGHILEVFQSGTVVRDPQGGIFSSKVTLPDERAGILMVFRVYRKLSFALVMSAQREMRVKDKVISP